MSAIAMTKRSWPAVAIATMAALAAALAATGLVQRVIFENPSGFKYLLTVAAPLFVLVAATSPHPLRIIMAPAVIAAPFADAAAFFGDLRISAVTPFLIAGGLVTVLSGPRPRGFSSLAPAALLAFPLLAIPLANGTEVGRFVTALAVLLAIAWLVARAAEEPGGMQVMIGAVAVSAAVQSVIAIWQARTGHQFDLYGSAGTRQFSADYFFTYGTAQRPVGTFHDPISLGNALAIALPLNLVLVGQVRLWAVRALLIVSALLTGIALALSLSRMSWIGALVGCTVTLCLVPRMERRVLMPAFVCGLICISVVGLLLAGPAVLDRLESLRDPTATQGQPAVQRSVAEGDRNRMEYWRITIEDGFAHHVVSGLGVGNLGAFLRDNVRRSGKGARAGTAIFIHAHSTYFQIMGEAGLFGVALLFLFLRGIYRDSVNSRRGNATIGAGVAGSAIALIICWSTDWVIHNLPVAATVGAMLGIVAAAGRSGSVNPRDSQTGPRTRLAGAGSHR